jgi:filamentous hemagglutinin family protein
MFGGVVALTLFASPVAGEAQGTVTPSGLGTTITQTGTTYEIIGGTRRGSTLFHSFGRFNLPDSADVANFRNETGIATSNILGRITGGEVSQIFGTIQTTDFGAANLFLINPAGWVFGSTASLNVGGAFHVSTADYLRLNDAAMFNVTPGPPDALLTSAPPAAFGFLGPTGSTGSISIEGSVLTIDRGKTLSIVGGDVTIQGAALTAPGGHIQIGSFVGAAEATVDGLVGSAAGLGRVEVSGTSISAAGDVRVDPGGNTSAVGGGTVLVRGRQVDILSGSGLDASGTLVFDADGNVVQGTPGGTVIIRGGQLLVDGSTMSSASFGAGAEDAIDISMEESITLMNGAALLSVNQAQLDGDGNFIAGRGGDIGLNADSISIGAFSSVLSFTGPAGDGGDIFMSGRSLTMDEASSVTSLALLEESPVGQLPSGSGGSIEIAVGRFSLSAGSALNSIISLVSSSAPAVPNQGGRITVTVGGEAQITGPGSGLFTIGSGATPGDISLEARTASLRDAALIQGGNAADPASEGANVTIRAVESVLVDGGAGISSQAFSLGLGTVEVSAETLTIDRGFINTGTFGGQPGGAIRIDVGTLSLNQGAQISSSSIFTAIGGGGDVTVNASKSVSISGSSPEPVLQEPFRGFVQDTSSGIFSTAASFGPGGNITIVTPALSIHNSGTLSVATSGSGSAGSINVTANTVELANGASISATSTGTTDALAGDISIATSDLRMENSLITTQSLLADGGNITITPTGSVLYMLDSQILTSVQSGVGGGGNITLGSQQHPFDFIVLSDSGIHADAFGGPGGNVRILAGNLLSDIPIQSAITASSALSTPGTIDIQANVTDVSGEVTQLPSDIVQAATLLRASCTARLAAGRTSSLVLAGREGVPPEPDGLLSSPLLPELNTILGSSPFEDDEQADRFPRWYRVSLDSRCAR